MNHEKIVEGLRSWMRVSTWDTHHPLDQQRFHCALKDVFDECGPAISESEFKSAMKVLAIEFKYPHQSENVSAVIDRYALTAEKIGSYLYDNADR